MTSKETESSSCNFVARKYYYEDIISVLFGHPFKRISVLSDRH